MNSSFGFQSGRGLTNLLLLVIASLLFMNSVSAQSEPIEPQAITGTGFTYQGQLRTSSGLVNGTCDLQFALWDAATGGTQLGAVQIITGVAVSNGTFTVQLNGSNQFGPNAFNGQARWLQIAVKCGGDAGFIALNPRQAITVTPYALALPGLRTEQNASTNNIIGGHESNSVSSGVYAATIAGGGYTSESHLITDNYGTIGGGYRNQAGNNSGSSSDALGATVAGGHNNQAQGSYSAIPGGQNNIAAGSHSFAAGRRAQANHQGSFVWADSVNADFASSANNQFAVRASGGLFLAQNMGPSGTAPIGTYYRDNSIVAWARVASNGTIDHHFNVQSVQKMGVGHYRITLKTNALTFSSIIINATAEIDVQPTTATTVRLISVDQSNEVLNRFDVFINNGNFAVADNDFMFIATGR
jgi:hypothetical protein